MAKTVEDRLARYGEGLSAPAQSEVGALLNSSQRRASTPLRKTFLRTTDESDRQPPLAQIVSRHGRGGDITLGLYLALVRRSSHAPWDTNLSARRWATLLDLEEPHHKGARRVRAALGRLADLSLIEITPDRGGPLKVVLLSDDGSGDAYRLPSDPSGARQPARRYLQVPDALWHGYIQNLSAPALALLLVLLAEPQSTDQGMWWSVGSFPRWYGLSESARTRGTSELQSFGLLTVKKQMLDTPRGQIKTANGDERDRVRNLYLLAGAAVRKPA